MRVLDLSSGKYLEVNKSYGRRLIENGKAVSAPQKAKTAASKKQDKKAVMENGAE